jgi:hypothetical protein
MKTQVPSAKRGKLNDEMLALVSAIIKYIDEADMQEKNKGMVTAAKRGVIK